MPVWTWRAIAVLCFVFCVSARPADFIQKKNGTSFVNNFCERASSWSNKSIMLRDGLKGMTISVTLLEPPNEDGHYASYHMKLLEEVAKRAQFSFHIIKQRELEAAESHTQLLLDTVRQTDVAVGFWTMLPERKEVGINSVYPISDMSFLVITQQIITPAPPVLDQLLEFAAPFHFEVWFVIVAGCVFSALLYWFFEHEVNEEDLSENNTPKNMELSMYLSTVAATGGGGFTPKTTPGRLLAISWTFTLMIIVNSYTANLASFLVASSSASMAVSSFSDVQTQKAGLCILDESAESTVMAAHYPQMAAQLNVTTNHPDKLNAVRDGTNCSAAVMSSALWDIYQVSSANAPCDIISVGAPFLKLSAGWSTAADGLAGGPPCSTFLRDVLGLHLGEMDVEGFLKSQWDDEITSVTVSECSDDDSGSSDDNGNVPLDLMNVGGPFVFHGIFTGIAFLIYFIEIALKRRRLGAVEQEPANETTVAVDDLAKPPNDISEAVRQLQFKLQQETIKANARDEMLTKTINNLLTHLDSAT